MNSALAFAQNDSDFDTTYTYANNPQDAAHKASINQLRRMFPDVSHDVLGNDHLSVLALQRAINYMTHVDQKFDLSATFSAEHFEKMKAEAIIWQDWQNSDSEVFPEALKYRPVEIAAEGDEEEEDETPVIGENGEILPPVERKPKPTRSPSSGSNYQLGKAIYTEDVAAGKLRSHTLERMEKELGMPLQTANVYYSKYKHEKN
jgi:hypothetical protein